MEERLLQVMEESKGGRQLVRGMRIPAMAWEAGPEVASRPSSSGV